MARSRRQHLRFDAYIPVRFSVGTGPARAHVTNISVGGVFLSTDAAVQPGSVLDLELLYPSPEEPIHASGRVVSVTSAAQADQVGKDPGVGVRFENLSDADRMRIVSCIRSLCSVHAGRALVVDGDVASARSVSSFLRQLRVSVVRTTSVAKALEIVQHEPFEVILAAVTLPDASGARFRESMYERQMEAAEAPFFLMSAGPSEEASAPPGSVRCLRKPVQQEQLTEAVSRALREQSGNVGKIWVAKAIEGLYLRLMLLGAYPWFMNEGAQVQANVFFEDGTLPAGSSGEGIRRVTVEGDGPDRVRIIAPPQLQPVAPIEVGALRAPGSLQRAIQQAFQQSQAQPAPPSDPAQQDADGEEAGRADFVVDAREFLPGGTEFDQRYRDVQSDLELDDVSNRAESPSQDVGGNLDKDVSLEFQEQAGNTGEFALDDSGGTPLEAERQVKEFLLGDATELEEGDSLELESSGSDPTRTRVCTHCGASYRVGAGVTNERLLKFCPDCLSG